MNRSQRAIRAIALYLPQFHPVPENDAWWGRGFTEWTNVAKAKPLFAGHYQPHLPADLGFYDLRVRETRAGQAELAREYGLGGFCYYHYWFNGRQILNRPLDEVLRLGEPDFPFCVCWANENWTRRWDGGDENVLLEQKYSLQDDDAHIQSLISMFGDPRYIRVDDRPVFLVYRTALLPDARATAALWRRRAKEAGFRDLYLVRVESWGDYTDPASIGFDAALEFAPDFKTLPAPIGQSETWDLKARLRNRLRRYRLMSRLYGENWIYQYDWLVSGMLAKPAVDYTRFRCVTPGWDNSPRRATGARVFVNPTPAAYERWLQCMVEETDANRRGDERLIFVNAWNEWAEGNHLEPDDRFGRAYLEATKRALERMRTDDNASEGSEVESSSRELASPVAGNAS
jgi:lipopolysaccharide biosynthesis protein